MIIIPLLVFLLSFETALGQVSHGFKGCGLYTFKGRVVKNANSQNKINPIEFKTHLGSRSELIFKINNPDDVGLLLKYSDLELEFIAEISKNMDDTVGELTNVQKVIVRNSDPLNPKNNSGIFLMNKKDCLK